MTNTNPKTTTYIRWRLFEYLETDPGKREWVSLCPPTDNLEQLKERVKERLKLYPESKGNYRIIKYTITETVVEEEEKL